MGSHRARLSAGACPRRDSGRSRQAAPGTRTVTQSPGEAELTRASRVLGLRPAPAAHQCLSLLPSILAPCRTERPGGAGALCMGDRSVPPLEAAQVAATPALPLTRDPAFLSSKLSSASLVGSARGHPGSQVAEVARRTRRCRTGSCPACARGPGSSLQTRQLATAWRRDGVHSTQVLPGAHLPACASHLPSEAASRRCPCERVDGPGGGRGPHTFIPAPAE